MSGSNPKLCSEETAAASYFPSEGALVVRGAEGSQAAVGCTDGGPSALSTHGIERKQAE